MGYHAEFVALGQTVWTYVPGPKNWVCWLPPLWPTL